MIEMISSSSFIRPAAAESSSPVFSHDWANGIDSWNHWYRNSPLKTRLRITSAAKSIVRAASRRPGVARSSPCGRITAVGG